MLAIEVFGTAFSVFQIVLGLGFVIFVHELGHFLVAKRADVRVDCFSLGFGPRLFSFRRGETEYCVSLIPLGGYVKMAGEEPGPDEGKTGDGREFTAKPARWRAAILLAGVGTNCVAAVPLLSISLLLGGNFSSNMASVIGWMDPESPAEKAGLLSGDRITRLDGVPVSRWMELEALGAGRSAGISFEWPLRVGALDKNPPAGFERAAEGDFFVSVNGTPCAGRGDILSAVRANPGKTLALGMARAEGGRPGAPYEIRVPVKSQVEYEPGLELEPMARAVVGQVEKGSPADRAGLRAGDRIVRVGDRPIETWTDLVAAIRPSTAPSLEIEVERGAARERLTVWPLAGESAPPLSVEVQRGGRRLSLDLLPGPPARKIGVLLQMQVREVRCEAARSAGLAAGDQPVEVRFRAGDGKESDWPVDSLASSSQSQGELTVVYRREGRMSTAVFPLTASGPAGTAVFPQPYAERVHRRLAPWELHAALAASLKEAAWILAFHVRVLAKLALSLPKGETKILKQVSGPVGIAAVTYKAAQMGHDHFFWILGMISLILALMNVLPIPLLDGGHLAFLVFEKLRGRPLSEKIQVYVQYAALALLISLVLVATWNDITILPKIFRG